MIPDLSPDAAPVVARTDPEAERLFMEIMADPLSADPYAGYQRLRELAPALLVGGNMLVLSRYADCDAVLRQRGFGKGGQILGSEDRGDPSESPDSVMWYFRDSMLYANPPDHTRLRRLVSSAFTARHVAALRPAVTARARALLDALAAEPDGDFMSAVALPLPVNVICDLLGIPEADRLSFTPKVHALVSAMEPAAEPETQDPGAQAAADLSGYLSELLAEKGARSADDLLSRLVAAGDDDDALTKDEMISTALLLFIAGFETTTNLLGNGLHALLSRPDQLDRLRADPALIPAAVEELLRYDSPVQLTARTVHEPATVTGAELTPGMLVLTLLGAANHDPAQFSNPATLDVGRPDGGHLSFAAGIHFCLGAHLTQLEAQVFLEQLALRYDIAPAGEPARRPGFTLRGFQRMPVTVSPRPGSRRDRDEQE
jgi:cytochrome P450